ncbi:MAG: hypothetical protein OEY29_08365 [Gammaproteobacteria bacterium]|nr:hypothetical protein [Gammaproteobacteria bacterium]
MKKYFSDSNKKIQFITITCYMLAALMLVQAVASINTDLIRTFVSLLFFVILYQAGSGMRKRKVSARRLSIGVLIFFSLLSSIVLIDMLIKLSNSDPVQTGLLGLVIFSIVGFTSTTSLLHLFTNDVKDEFN